MPHSIEEEFAATIACLLAGRIDGAQAVATLTAIHNTSVLPIQREANDEKIRAARLDAERARAQVRAVHAEADSIRRLRAAKGD